MGVQKDAYGISIGFLWEFFGVSMIFFFDFYISIGLLWDFCVISMVFPWLFLACG